MNSHLLHLIWITDLVLFCTLLFLSLGAVVYFSFQEGLARRRLYSLVRIKRNLRFLSSREHPKAQTAMNELIRRLTPRQLFSLTKNREKFIPKNLERYFRDSLLASQRIIEIEKIAVQKGNKWLKIEAVICLGCAHSPRALEILKTSLCDKDEEIAYYSMLALGQIKNSSSAGILLDFISRHIFSGQKIVSLLESFPPTIIDEVLKATKHLDPLVRFWAVKLLSKSRAEKPLNEVVPLTQDPSADVRAAACECLSSLKDERTERVLLERLRDSEWFVRMQAVRALSKISGEKYVPQFVDLLIHDPSPYVKESVKNAITQAKDQALPYLEKCFLEGDMVTKKYCTDALVDLGLVKKMLEGALSENIQEKKNSLNLLNQLIQSGIYFGLKKILDEYPEDRREKILLIVTGINSALAERIAIRETPNVS